jgi:probable F420-dependent oxidoreductase
MHIGLSRPPTPPHPVADVDCALVARMAEEFGFESIFYGEHPVTPVEGGGVGVHAAGVPYFQDTLVALARASSVTSKIKIGSGVFLIPVHHAVLFAKQLASLDFYSGGRLIIGAGVGWSRGEIEVLGGNFDRRWAQARESIELMKRLWTEDVVEHHGEFYDVPPISVFPKPYNRPHPPILIPGPNWDNDEPLTSSRNMRAFRRIVAFADGWLPALVGNDAFSRGAAMIAEGRSIIEALCREVGRSPDDIGVTVLLRTEIQDGDLTPPELVSRDVLRTYDAVGVERAIVTIPTITGATDARSTLERMASHLL